MFVLIFVDSHVRSLFYYARNQHPNNIFILQNMEKSVVGISGGRIGRSRDIRVVEAEIQRMRPQKLIIHIAGNDIDHIQVDEALVREGVSKKMAICDLFLSQYHLNNIYACQLLPIFSTRFFFI